MQSLVRISTLKASHNKIKDISALISCKKIIKLKLNSNHIYHFEKAIKILKSLPKLLNLSLLANPCISKIKDSREKLCNLLNLEKIDKEFVLMASTRAHLNNEKISNARNKLTVESLKGIKTNTDYQKEVYELKQENVILKKELGKIREMVARSKKSNQVL